MMKHKVEILNKRLKEVRDKFEALKRCGISEEILLVYLRYKTGFALKECKKFINSLDDFYNKLCKDLIAKELEKENVEK